MPNWRDLVLPSEDLYVNPMCSASSVYSDFSDGSDVCSAGCEFEPFSDDIAECTGCGCYSPSSGSDMEVLDWSMFEPARKNRPKPGTVLTAELHLLANGNN